VTKVASGISLSSCYVSVMQAAEQMSGSTCNQGRNEGKGDTITPARITAGDKAHNNLLPKYLNSNMGEPNLFLTPGTIYLCYASAFNVV